MFFLGTPIRRSEGVIPALAEDERHWCKGYSADDLARAWVGAGRPTANDPGCVDE